MKDVFDKLSIRTTDYFAAIDVDNESLLSKICDSVKGIACAGEVGKKKFDNLKDVKIVKSLKQLDDSVFDKVLAKYSDTLNLKSLVRITDHFGMVLICNVPKNKVGILADVLGRKAGIFELWSIPDKSSVDILFKVRKY